jgi:hypothetical protein
MAVKSAGVPVVAAAHVALNVGGITALATQGVHTHVPQGTKPPYVAVRLVSEVRWDSYGTDGKEVVLAVDVYTAGKGPTLAGQIIDQVITLLAVAPPTLAVAGHTVVSQQYDNGQDAGDEWDGATVIQHYVLFFLVRVIQI